MMVRYCFNLFDSKAELDFYSGSFYKQGKWIKI